MSEAAVCLLVHEDILKPLEWILTEFTRDVTITSFRSLETFESAFHSKPEAWDILILDATTSTESTLSYLQKVKNNKPELKIILVVPPVADKEEIIEIIKAKMVQGLAIKPFTGEVIAKYLEKLRRRI
jgi:DNA-binding NtrC family response regulator